MRFSNYADAVRALSDVDSYNLRGAILKISPATERIAQQNAKGGKVKKDESKMGRVNKNRNKTMTNGLVDKEAVVTELKPGSSLNSSLPSPKEMKTAPSEESWEVDGELSPKMIAKENKRCFNQDNFVTCIYKEDGLYPIHVSNFPAGTTQVRLKQLLYHPPPRMCPLCNNKASHFKCVFVNKHVYSNKHPFLIVSSEYHFGTPSVGQKVCKK